MTVRAPRGTRGSTVVFVAVVLVALLGVLAFVVDLGYAWVIRVQLRNAADAGAHAAVAELDGTAEGVAAARTVAISWAALNAAGGAPVAVDRDDVRFGAWDPERGVFVPRSTPSTSPACRSPPTPVRPPSSRP